MACSNRKNAVRLQYGHAWFAGAWGTAEMDSIDRERRLLMSFDDMGFERRVVVVWVASRLNVLTLPIEVPTLPVRCCEARSC